MTTVRKVKLSDLDMVSAWAEHYDVPKLDLSLLPMESSFIIEHDGKAVSFISAFLTNGSIAWLECFIGNPSADRAHRREANSEGVAMIEAMCRASGYRRLICLGPNEKLTAYYEAHGYQPRLSATVLWKEI